MMKMDNGTACTDKIFLLNNEDIELIVSLLHEECTNCYWNRPDGEFFKERYEHCQDLIMELTK